MEFNCGRGSKFFGPVNGFVKERAGGLSTGSKRLGKLLGPASCSRAIYRDVRVISEDLCGPQLLNYIANLRISQDTPGEHAPYNLAQYQALPSNELGI